MCPGRVTLTVSVVHARRHGEPSRSGGEDEAYQPGSGAATHTGR